MYKDIYIPLDKLIIILLHYYHPNHVKVRASPAKASFISINRHGIEVSIYHRSDNNKVIVPEILRREIIDYIDKFPMTQEEFLYEVIQNEYSQSTLSRMA